MIARISATRRYVCFLLSVALIVGLAFVPEHVYAAKKNKKVTVYVIEKDTYRDKAAGYADIKTYTYNKDGLIKAWEARESWGSGSEDFRKMTFYYKKNRITSVKYYYGGTRYYKPKYKKGLTKSIAGTEIDYDGNKRNLTCKISRDKKGRVVKMVDNICGYTTINTYKYNKKGLIVKNREYDSDADKSYGVTYQYDKKNRIVALNGYKLKMKNNRVVEYLYSTYKYKKIKVPKKNVPKIIMQQNYIIGYHDPCVLMF